MRNLFTKIDEIVLRFVTWVTFFGIVATFMSWVASHITQISLYGWGVVVFAGVGTACIVTLVISAALVAWRYFNPLPERAPIAWRKAETIVYHHLIDIEHSDLFFGPRNEKLEARIVPAKNTINTQVYLDTQEYKGGTAPNFWHPKGGRLILKRNVNFVKGIQISIDLMELDNDHMRRSWRWAGGNRPLESLTCYRCQLVFVAEHELPDYFYFIVSFHDGNKPSLTGEHMFLYAGEWKSEDAKARNNNAT